MLNCFTSQMELQAEDKDGSCEDESVKAEEI